MMTFQENCEAFLTKGPDRVSPFFVPMFIPDIAAGLASIRFGLQGPNFATVSACSSSAHALGKSWELIRDGVADMMLTGGCEAAITGLSVSAFANMKALSTRNDAPAAARHGRSTRAATDSCWRMARAWRCSSRSSVPRRAARRSSAR